MSENTSSGSERGAYILREPKGRPDVILICERADTAELYNAANILAVQGYTARLVHVCDRAVFEGQSLEYRESVLPEDRASDRIFELATPAETAQAARARILDSLEENGCV